MPHRTRRLTGVLAAGALALSTLATLSTLGATTADAASQATAKPAKPGKPKPGKPKPGPGWPGQPGRYEKVQLLSFNDFHGNLEPPAGSGGRLVTDHALDPNTRAPVNVTTDAGGVEYLATHLRAARKGHPNTVTVAAGDIVGASTCEGAGYSGTEGDFTYVLVATDAAADGRGWMREQAVSQL